MHDWEKNVVESLNAYRNTYVDAFSALISDVSFLVFAWLLVAIGILLVDVFSGLAVFLALALVFVLHFIVSEGILKGGARIFSLERVRPYMAYPKLIHPIGKRFLDSSFPSSHVASMAGGLFIVTYFYPTCWPISLCALLVMCWSRLHNGMHYPSDILAGIGLGVGYGYVSLEILRIIF